jgi:hypothetical protein
MSEEKNIQQNPGEIILPVESPFPGAEQKLFTHNLEPNTPMEVHHHPDLHHKKKNFREYFLEFLMIFLAVTMGFFAESLRESIADREKEKQYMESLVNDLEQDTIHMNRELVWENTLINGLDSITQIIYAGKYNDSTVKQLYAMNPRYVRPFGIRFVDKTSSQLKNAGGLRMIRKKDITDAIASYWETIEMIEAQSSRAENNRALARGLINRLFYTKYYDNSGKLEDIQFKSTPKLLSMDTQLLSEYANHIYNIRTVLKSFLNPTVIYQLKAAKELLALIKKEYSLE